MKPGTRAALSSWRGDEITTVETEGQMLQRAVGHLMGQKNITQTPFAAQRTNRL